MKQIVNIDASSLSSAGCIINWKRVTVDGYRDKVSGAALVYGSAVHKYIETMYKTKGNIAKSRDAAFEVFRKPKVAGKSSQHLLDEKHLLVTCFNVWEDYVLKDSTFQTLELDNGPAVEVNFSFPFHETANYEFRLTGTIDRIGQIRNGCYAFRDWKTTSKYNIPEYLSEYKMSKQLRMYTLAFRKMHRLYPDSILGKIGGQAVGAIIDGIFLKVKASDNEYIASDLFMFSDDTMNEFEAVLEHEVHKLGEALESGRELPREGIVKGVCKTEYKCKFWNVCGAPKQVQQVMLDRDFAKVHYDPLNFGASL